MKPNSTVLLKDFDEIAGVRIAHMESIGEQHPEMVEESGQLNWKYFEKNIRPKYPITIRHEKNSIAFNFGEGKASAETLFEVAMALCSYSHNYLSLDSKKRLMSFFRGELA